MFLHCSCQYYNRYTTYTISNAKARAFVFAGAVVAKTEAELTCPCMSSSKRKKKKPEKVGKSKLHSSDLSKADLDTNLQSQVYN